MSLKIAVIGGGSWATAIVKMLCNNVEQLHWWVRNEETVEFIKKYQHNPNYLSSVELDLKKISISNDLKKIAASVDVLVMAIPSAFLKESIASLTPADLKNKTIFSAIKGIVPEDNLIIGKFSIKNITSRFPK